MHSSHEMPRESRRLGKQLKQIAQLSQRDRTAGWVSYGLKWKTGTGRQYFKDIRSIFNHCDVIGQQSNRIL